METLFYAIGAALVVIALIVAAIGMRRDDFPSTNALRIGVLLIALVVVATGYTAVQASEEEALAREEEEDRLAAEEADELAAENAELGGGGSASSSAEVDPASGNGPGDDETVTEGGAATASTEEGSAVFVDNGCGGCHTLADQGNQALGEIGPNLDAELVNEDAAYIETSIVDPSAEVVEGFGDNIMPSDFEEIIPPADLAALVAYLDEVTSEPSGAK